MDEQLIVSFSQKYERMYLEYCGQARQYKTVPLPYSLWLQVTKWHEEHRNYEQFWS
jgi:hypothetical protein